MAEIMPLDQTEAPTLSRRETRRDAHRDTHVGERRLWNPVGQIVDRLRRGPAEHYVPLAAPPCGKKAPARRTDSYGALYSVEPCGWGVDGAFVPPAAAVPAAPPGEPACRGSRPFRLHGLD